VPLVLAIEPDLRQAAIVKRIVREKVLADVAVVDSRDAALEAIRLAMPDVLLISALLSPRDEDELIAHLRTLDNAGHLQTHTIPQLASALAPGEEPASGGLLSVFRRKKKKDPEVAPAGCEPDMFAEEIRSYLQRAADQKRERLDGQAQHGTQDHAWRAAPQKTGAVTDAEPAPEVTPSGSSWASPFEWKPSNPSSLIAGPEPLIANPESLIAHPESIIARPEPLITHPESPIAYPEEPPSLMAHLRPPSGVTTLRALRESLAAEETQLVAPAEVIRQEIEPVRIAAATPDPEPIPEAAPIQEMVLSLEAAPIREAAPVQEVAPIPQAAPMPDAGSRIKDSGLGIRDKRLGTRDSRLGALASWARSERAGRDTGEKTDDLYGLLMGLAVPPAVVAVGYGRGCRIRRVRVPAAPESPLAESNGPVILSKRALAEQREQRT
jgi:CheY-like chemotaxis protein